MIFAIIIFLFTIFTHPVSATEKFGIIINPVRGSDFWQIPQKNTDFVNIQKQSATDNQAKSTWLIRPDYFINTDQDIAQFTKYQQNGDEIGMFLEVTPSWAKLAGVNYDQTKPWYFAGNVFLSGYNPPDRIRLIDSAMKEFKHHFGHYPQTVGAWHVDPHSAKHLSEKYGVKTILICADQFSTDGYQIWGGWWGVPYYPSKNNLLIPAQNLDDKLDVVVLWWAARHPQLGYGGGVKDSTYSVQANDYLLHQLDQNFFSDLSKLYLNPLEGQFGQITIGLENDTPITESIINQYQQQVTILKDQQVDLLTANQFYQWYSEKFKNLSPPHTVGNNQAKWIMTTTSRTGLFFQDNQWLVYDHRLYTPDFPDPYLFTKNLTDKLYWYLPAKIDHLSGIGQTQPWSDFESSNSPSPISLLNATLFIALIVITFGFFLLKIPLRVKLIILAGSALISTTMFKSGLNYLYGLGFWGPNGHDAIWHLSVINQIKKSFPPQNPIFSGTQLNNYHWGYDLFASLFSNITNLSVLDTYFRILPLLMALLIGLFSYQLAKTAKTSSKTAIIFVLLNYFAGSFGWLISLIRNQTIGGESLFWSMQSASTLINPPYALSLVILLLGLILWLKHHRQNKISFAIILGILFSLLTGVKIYAGILTGLAFSVYYLIKKLTKTATKFDFILPLSMAISSSVIFVLLGLLSSPSLLEFQPFWFVHSLINSIDKLYLPKIATLRQNLSQQLFSYKLPFYLALEFILFFIFLIGNMGIRVLGLKTIYQKIKNKHIKSIDQFILPFMFFGILFPTLFVQKGTAWNTIQFFYYFLFFANFYLAQFIARQKSKLVIIILLLITSITSYSTLKDYFGSPPPASLPRYELQALNFLKDQPNGTVLTYPYDKHKKDGLSTPLPLYTYETTAYVSAITTKTTFLEDEMNLNIIGFDWPDRRRQADDFFISQNLFAARGFLINNQISYIYLVNEQTLPFPPEDLQISQIFQNGQSRVYLVQR